MYFRATYFHNFRNLHFGRRNWAPGFNLIAGPNGAGKTNFIEGLSLISGWGPLERMTKIPSLLRWDVDGGRRASLWGGVGGEEETEVLAGITTRCSLRCGDKAVSAGTMRSTLPVLPFTADQISLIRGGASCRRQFLDKVCALVVPPYALRLYDYKKALRQKSALLRRGCEATIADRVLVPLGAWIWGIRGEVVGLVSAALHAYRELLPAPLALSFLRGGAPCRKPEPDAEGEMRRAILENRERERFAKRPLVGPQRDDVHISCEGRPAAVALSRGQSRRAASSVILAAAAVVERSLRRRPVLLFDELTSELDADGRRFTADALLRTGYQVFATTTEPLEYRGVTVHEMRAGAFA
jgi:Recombinational DNA repair ATPase (RecF pathway)